MLDLTSIERNCRFLVIEVTKQVKAAQRVLQGSASGEVRKIVARDDYIDHLKSIIENTCFSILRRHGDISKRTVDTLRATTLIAQNLERIADHAVSIVRQTQHLNDPSFLVRLDPKPFFDDILDALRLVDSAFQSRDAALAARICRIEEVIDDRYAAVIQTLRDELGADPGEAVADRITSLFIFHYLERMGDCLLNVGEAIIFARMGERLKFDQYRSLHETVAAMSGHEPALERIDFESIWGTRSGCRIGKVSEIGGDDAGPGVHDHKVIYKEGERSKIRRERDNIERWSQLMPGLPPRLVQYREGDSDATMLIEFLEGRTMMQIVIGEEVELADDAILVVQRTIDRIWVETKRDGPIAANFIKQLESRLEDVYAVHRYFDQDTERIGALTIPSFTAAVERLRDLDEVLVAPFAVFGHGDFNLDNIIYDPETRQIHFIDLYRSAEADPVQDLSVLLVSNFRVPIFEPATRRRLERVMSSFLEFGRAFAARHDDDTFDARLALGLARSFATSTRFESERSFAENMLDRAAFLLQQVEEHRGRPWSEFRLVADVLAY